MPEPACECSENGGYCTRYGLQQTPHHVHLCKTQPAYRELWAKRAAEGKVPAPVPVDPPVLLPRRVSLPVEPCVHRGDDLTGAAAKGLGLNPMKRWSPCFHPKTPLGAFVCSCQGCGPRCPGYTVDSPTRHLLYHILPVSGTGVWQRGVDQLTRRWNLFTGVKAVAVATGPPIKGQGTGDTPLVLDTIETVRAYLPPDCHVIEVPNDPALWELASWPALWSYLYANAADEGIVLYAHAKGTSRPVDSPVHRWAALLYTLVLDHMPHVERELQTHPLCGPLKKVGNFFQGRPLIKDSRWHYSGNFWWGRVGELRLRLDPRKVPLDPWAAEAWVGMAYAVQDAGTVFAPRDPGFMMYDRDHQAAVEREYHVWLRDNPPVTGPTLSVIVPTVGRPSLQKTLDSITGQMGPGDELIVERDASADWGMTPRNRGMRKATGDYLLFIDDDDTYLPGAFEKVRRAVLQHPNRMLLFKMQRGGEFNDTLWTTEEVKQGNVSTQMVVVPNDLSRLGRWGSRYEGDFDFIRTTAEKLPPVWIPEVIARWR